MMTIREAIDARHSVRAYTAQPIEGEVLAALESEIARVNTLSGLHIRLVRNDPDTIAGLWAYGAFENAVNYLALVGPDTEKLYPLCGYWGEHLVLFAETLGLNTCWIAGSYKKKQAKKAFEADGTLAAIIAIGYGAKPGKPHKSKKYEQVVRLTEPAPDWFAPGVEAALLAPTAINQQKFRFTMKDGKPYLKALKGPYSMIDAGIVQYHFDVGAGHPVYLE